MAEYVSLDKEKASKKKEIYSFGKYTFSKIEVKHLLISLFFIILTITIMDIKSSYYFSLSDLYNLDIKIILVYLIAIGSGFILHELAHKIMAQYYNFVSEFRADFQSLFFIFVIAFFSPFLILAPGAVWVLGRPSLKQNGFISIVGPLTNLTIALICFWLILLSNPSSFLFLVLTITIKVNLILGIFNMLPFWVLDGAKIIKWDKIAYFGLLIMLVSLFFIDLSVMFDSIRNFYLGIYIVLFFSYLGYLYYVFKKN